VDPNRVFRIFGIAGQQLFEQVVDIGFAGCKHVTASYQINAVVALPGNVFKLIDAVVGEALHDGMGPPVAVVLARMRRGEFHRPAHIHKRDGQVGCGQFQIVSGRYPDDTGADDKRVCRAIDC
jgi:hypothetical protein